MSLKCARDDRVQEAAFGVKPEDVLPMIATKCRVIEP
jgi:hypothetical protein